MREEILLYYEYPANVIIVRDGTNRMGHKKLLLNYYFIKFKAPAFQAGFPRFTPLNCARVVDARNGSS